MEKLKSVLKIHVFPLLAPAIKTVLFGALLFLATEKKSLILFALFLFLAFYFYFRKLLEWRKFFYAFLALVFYSLIVINFFNGKVFLAASTVFFALLFFLVLGIKNFVFINRETIFSFLYWALYFVAGIVFFAADKLTSLDLISHSFLIFLVFYLLLKESLEFLHPDTPRKKRNLLALSASFLAAQSALIIRWLPLGFLNSAVMTTILIIVLEDLISYHLKGALSRQIIVKNAAVLAILTLLIFLV